MVSLSVTCHPTQVDTPRFTPCKQAGTRFTYPGGMDGWVGLGDRLYTEMVYPPTSGHPSKYYNPAVHGRESNSQPADHESDALLHHHPPSHLVCVFMRVYAVLVDRSQMPATLPEQLTIEKTPSYFVTRGVAERIHNMSRDIRLLVVVRDPVTRALSDYAQSASKRPHLASFENLAFVKGKNLSVVDITWGPIRLGLYARYVAPWQYHFTPDRLLFVSGERLVTDPAREMASVQSFLGLRPFINSQNFYFNATKGFPCLRLSSGTSHCLGKTKGRRHPSVNTSALQRLRNFYRPHNALFYQMTGIDFGWQWKLETII